MPFRKTTSKKTETPVVTNEVDFDRIHKENKNTELDLKKIRVLISKVQDSVIDYVE